jgi:hypothetical protein
VLHRETSSCANTRSRINAGLIKQQARTRGPIVGYRCRIKKILSLSIALSLLGLVSPMAATALSSVRFEPTEVIKAAITKAAKTVKFYDIIPM